MVNLTEWPSAILGGFDPEFLELPEEVLVTVMRDHQKYFAVEDSRGKLLAAFSGGAEHRWRSGRHHPARSRARAAGALQRCPLLLADRPEASAARARTWLKNVTFQKDLGSYYDKVLRVQRVASWLCENIRSSGMAVRPGVVHKAACWQKPI